MNILHHHLEAVEAAGLWYLNFSREALSEVLKHDSITGCEKGQYMFDEVLLVFLQILPIFYVLAKVDLIDGPEACHLVLVHLPDVVVLDRQQDKSIRVVLE